MAYGSSSDRYFSYLSKDVSIASLNATAKYNGNIAWMEWTTGANCIVNALSRNKAGYGFTYDGLDRMTASKSGEWVSSAWTNFDRYNESNTYDLNGNILTLVRKGYLSAGNYPTVDNLTYTYDGTNIHRVNSIADASGSTLGYPAASGSYTYDSNGNQISDGAKGFTAITYNHLNLPTKFTQGANTIEIQYDAQGRKLKKILSSGTTKSYIGNIEYVGSTVEAIYHAEGRARNNAGTYVYEYVIKDHLGDTRVAFTNTSGTIALIQENHYYPFGMQQGGWTAEPSPTNAYKYNGKELNLDFGLNLSDYGARWYDGGIGRWSSVDPMAEGNTSFTPFQYSSNNPLSMIDIDGQDDIYYDSRGREIRHLRNGNDDRYFDAVSNKDGTITVSGERSGAPKPAEDYGTYGGIFGRINVSQSAGGAFSNFGANTILKAAEFYATGEIMGWAFKPLGGMLGKFFSNTATKGGIEATESVIKGFTGHATNQAITRGFKTVDILKIIKEGKLVEATGRYGSQMRYTLGGNTLVVNAQGKVVTLFSNAPGTANGLGKGFFIPFK